MGISLLFGAVRAHDVAAKTDGQLLEQFLVLRDQAAFAVLLKRHGPTVLGVCRRVLGNETDAEDAFQATFLVLIGKARSLTGRAILGDWLHEVARYTALKARTALARRRAKERGAARPESAPADTERDDWLPRLDAELQRLPKKYRLPVLLCELEGKTRRQAAAQLGWPEGTVAGRLARARAILSQRLLRGMPIGAGGLPALLATGTLQAALRPKLIESIMQAAVRVAAGETTSGVISATALTLSQGVTKAMFWNQVRLGALILVALAALARGGLAFFALAGERPDPVNADAKQLVARQVQAPDQAQAAVPDAPRAQAQDPQIQTSQAQSGATFGEELYQLDGHKGGIAQIAFSKDGKRLVSASSDETVKVWDTTTRKALLTFNGHGKQVNAVAFSPTSDKVASGGADGSVIVWDPMTGKELLTFTGHGQFGTSVHCVAFSPDGKFIASGNGAASGTISTKIWDAANGNVEASLPGFGGMVSSVVFSADGKRLATASGDKKLRVWDTASAKEVASITQPANYFWSVRFSPDGKKLVTANEDRTLTVWDAETCKEVLVLKGHNREVTNAVFSPDGKLLASVAYDATLRLWDAYTGKELDRRSVGREAFSVTFNGDGTQIAAGVNDGLIRVWQVKAGK